MAWIPKYLECGGEPVFDSQFDINVFEMFFHRPGFHAKDNGNFRIGFAPRKPGCHFGFPRRESQRLKLTSQTFHLFIQVQQMFFRVASGQKAD